MKRFAWIVLFAAGCGPTVKTVAVEPGMARMSSKGASLSLHAVAKDEKGQAVPDAQFTWSSGNAAVASVDAAGKVTALKSGNAEITAAAGDVKGIVAPNAVTLTGPGQTAQLHAMVKDDSGNVVPGMPVVWTSSNANVAAVDTRGMVHALAGGSAVVTARQGSLTASATVTVNVPKFDKLAIAPKGPLKLKAGGTQQLTLTATEGGKPVQGVSGTWSSSDMKAATVSPAGMVTAVKKGKATITAEAGEKKAEVKVVVK
jgi:uncharacterized protein YjdB